MYERKDKQRSIHSYIILATGCNLDKKPAFRYSGCHAYEVSALNVVLGKVFDFDESKYIIDDKYKLFVKNSDIEVRKNEEEDNDVEDEDIEMT